MLSVPRLSERLDRPERMDDPGEDPGTLIRSLRYLAWTNRWLGGRRAVMRPVKSMLNRAPASDRCLWILDVGTGGGDIPRALLKWCRKAGIACRVVAAELHPVSARYARERSKGFPELTVIRADGRRLPLQRRSFDLIICSNLLHHLSDEEVIPFLNHLPNLSARWLVVSDLLRRRRALFWIRLLTLLANPISRHDGPLSVRRALTLEEARAVADDAGLEGLRLEESFGQRFVLWGEIGDERVRGG